MKASTISTNGTTPGASRTDEAIDSLYSFWPGAQPAPQPLPEAAFSLTLKGTLDGQEALLTARGQTAAAFQANLEAIRGLLDAPTQAPAQASSTAEGWCRKHGLQMTQTHKDGKTWWSHKTPDGWCKGR